MSSIESSPPPGFGDLVETASSRRSRLKPFPAGLNLQVAETDFQPRGLPFGTKLHGFTTSHEETVDLRSDLLDIDLVLTLMAECERGTGTGVLRYCSSDRRSAVGAAA